MREAITRFIRDPFGVQARIDAAASAADTRLREAIIGYDSQLTSLQQRLSQYELLTATSNQQEPTRGERLAMVADSRFLVDWQPEAASATAHYTGMAIGNTLNVTIRPKKEDGEADTEDTRLQTIFDSVFNAEHNETVFSLLSLANLSDSFLADGEVAFTFFIDEAQLGRSRVRTVNPTQIEEFISNPDDQAEVWFYKRVWNTSSMHQRVLYYRHWKLADEDRDQAVQWLFSEDGPAVQHNEEENLAKDQAGNDAYMYVMTMNNRGVGRGRPFLAQAITWVYNNVRFVQNRATIVQNRATYLDEYTVTGGSRAVSSLQTQLRSTLARPGAGVFGNETNPAPATGSSLVHNRAVDAKQRSVDTGADDAMRDARIFRSQVSAAVGVPIALLYMDAEASGNLNAIIELMRKSRHRWERYRGHWHDFLRSFASFILRLSGVAVDSYVVDIDQPPMVEEALKELTEAIRLGKQDKLIPAQEAARLYMNRLGSNNIDELLAQLEKEKEEAMAMLPQMPGGNQPGQEDNQLPNDQEDSDEADQEEALVLSQVRQVLTDLGQEPVQANGAHRL